MEEHAPGYHQRTQSTNLDTDGKKLEGKSIENIFNKITKESFLTLEKEMSYKYKSPTEK